MIKYCLGICLVICCGCASSKVEKPTEEVSKKRIHQFYGYWEQLEYKQCIQFLTPDENENEKESLTHLKSIPYKVVGYEIEEIRIDGYKAKVRMRTTKIEGSKKDTGEYYDYWSYVKDNWYLDDLLRSDGMEGAVKEYDFEPNKFK